MGKSPHLAMQVVDALIESTETTIAHGLSRTPLEAFVLDRDTGTTVFRGSTSWNSTNIFLQAGAQTNARLLIL